MSMKMSPFEDLQIVCTEMLCVGDEEVRMIMINLRHTSYLSFFLHKHNFSMIFLHIKARKSRQNIFRSNTAKMETKQISRQNSINSDKKLFSSTFIM